MKFRVINYNSSYNFSSFVSLHCRAVLPVIFNVFFIKKTIWLKTGKRNIYNLNFQSIRTRSLETFLYFESDRKWSKNDDTYNSRSSSICKNSQKDQKTKARNKSLGTTTMAIKCTKANGNCSVRTRQHIIKKYSLNFWWVFLRVKITV